LIGNARCRRRAGKAQRRAAAAAAATHGHAVEAVLQHLLHFAGEVRQRAVGQRKRRRIEHRDLAGGGRHDEWRAVGVDGRAGKRVVEGEQPVAADEINGIGGAGQSDAADHARAENIGQRGGTAEDLNRIPKGRRDDDSRIDQGLGAARAGRVQ
jgi:hypothetical protein